jgi:Caspase domain
MRDAAVRTFGAFICIVGLCFGTQAQQNPSTESYDVAYARAHEQCNALWADHTFDSLRKKIPLIELKPTFSQLTNSEKLLHKDRPMADSAIKVVEKCRELYAPAYAKLPQPIQIAVHGIERKQDALIAELYTGKITFGAFKVAMDRLAGEFAQTVSAITFKGVKNVADASERSQSEKLRQSSSPPKASGEAKAAVSSVQSQSPPQTRLALVIGNSAYTNLSKLSNPQNDARAISEVLKQLGYQTRLAVNASEQTLRSEIRRFASDSRNYSVALVFYAGHGAQLGGSNYLLPVDMEIPRTEADIQLSGFKVDDLVNLTASNTKIVFLDACRDNPALFRNMVKGRGAAPTGLAPSSSSSFTPTKPGGGIFIAYATDAGAVAEDGKEKHSPFTQALLRYIEKPVSIDDLFSLVTREVRLVTKNNQRPYKYGSLENIICLTPVCSAPAVTEAAISLDQEVRKSENEELQIALQTSNYEALDAFLLKYPETRRRDEVTSKIRELKRAEYTEWTLYDIGDQHLPQYMRISSIQRFGSRASVRLKNLLDDSKSKNFHGREFPEAASVESVTVCDCNLPMSAIAEDDIMNKSGDILFHYKWGLPEYLNLSIGMNFCAQFSRCYHPRHCLSRRFGDTVDDKKRNCPDEFDTYRQHPLRGRRASL